MQKAHKEKVREYDTIAWKFCGEYILSAVMVAVDRNLHGQKANSKYIQKPILQEDNKHYNSIRESLATEENPKPYLSESDYRAKLQEYADNGTIDKDIFNKIKKIWEFNDSLKDHR